MSGISWIAGNNLIKILVRVGIVAILSRLLEPGDFGKAAAVALVLSFGDILAEFGIYSSLVQRPVLDRSFVSTATWVSLGVTCCVSASMYFGAEVIGGLLRVDGMAPLLEFAAFSFLPHGLAITPRALAHRAGQFRLMALSEAGTYCLVYAPIAVFMALTGWGVWSLVVSQMIQATIQFVIYLHYSNIQLPLTFSFSAIGELIDRTSSMSVGRVADYFGQQGDNIVVSRVFGVESLGFYSRAFTLMKMPTNVLGSALQTVLFPKFSRLLDKPDEARAILLSGLSVLSAVLLPVSVLLVMNAELCVRILLGAKWLQIVPIFQILGLGMFFRIFCKFLDSAVAGFGLFWRSALYRAVYAGIIFGGAWVLVKWGMSGVAFSTLIGIVVLNLLLWHAVHGHCPLPVRQVALACKAGFMSAGIAVACGWLAQQSPRLIVLSDGQSLAVVLLVHLALYLAIVLWFRTYLIPVLLVDQLMKLLRRKSATLEQSNSQ